MFRNKTPIIFRNKLYSVLELRDTANSKFI